MLIEERFVDMVTLPFLALILLLIVAFFMGIVIGATLKGPTGNLDNKEAHLPDSDRTREYTFRFTVTEDQLKDPKRLDGNKVVLDFSGQRPSLDKELKLVKPHDAHIKRFLDKNALDQVDWKLSVNKDDKSIELNEWRKKRPGDNKE